MSGRPSRRQAFCIIARRLSASRRRVQLHCLVPAATVAGAVAAPGKCDRRRRRQLPTELHRRRLQTMAARLINGRGRPAGRSIKTWRRAPALDSQLPSCIQRPTVANKTRTRQLRAAAATLRAVPFPSSRLSAASLGLPRLFARLGHVGPRWRDEFREPASCYCLCWPIRRELIEFLRAREPRRRLERRARCAQVCSKFAY